MGEMNGRRDMRFVVIGAGMSGVLAAIKLKEAGFKNFAVYEKGDSVGGTWRENHYPGLTCDLAAHAYTYTFERNPDWSQLFAPGPEIHAYFIRTADKYGVTPLIRFNEEVASCVYEGGQWKLETKKGTKDRADFLIAATGPLHHPNTPKLEGMERFGGSMFHSARWDDSVPLDGKRIGVVGTGSTGIQLVTALQPIAGRVYQVQRTAQWVKEVPFQRYTEEDKAAFRKNPALIEDLAQRFAFGKEAQDFMKGVANESSEEMRQLEEACRQDLETRIKDPVLREKLRPDYRPACKRLVFSWNYFDAVQQANVEVVTDEIDSVEPRGIRFKSGRLIELDVIVLATGFHASQSIRPTRIVGANGMDLEKFWTPDPKAYFALAMPNFPNLFFLNGPNGPVGNFSLIDIAEKQMHYVMQMVNIIASGRCKAMSVKPEAFEKFDRDRKQFAKKTIWATGCKSWYLDSEGLPSIWPFPIEFLIERTRKPLFEDYLYFDDDGLEVDLDLAALREMSSDERSGMEFLADE